MLRIEDTDSVRRACSKVNCVVILIESVKTKKRTVPDAMRSICETLGWAGLQWDEGTIQARTEHDLF